MTRIEAEHRFNVPLREAYDYITHLEHWPEYRPGSCGWSRDRSGASPATRRGS
jgi:hypothetical protein